MYRIQGLERQSFVPLFALSDDVLAARNARRVTATGPGFPCRVSLAEAEAGETLLLLNHVSHDVATPFRTSYAIYVREGAEESVPFHDSIPALIDRRTIGLRGFDADGMLRSAALALPGEADARIRALFDRPEIDTIHAHNAAHGCFLAKVERD